MKTKKPNTLTFSRFLQFYRDYIDPRFQLLQELTGQHGKKFNQHDQQFDDLYKKFEDLNQEYIFANRQLKRLTTYMEIFQSAVFDINSKLIKNK